jgi:hypothetical protein
MFTLKESTRIKQKSRHEETWKMLRWMRASDSEAVAAATEEIRTGVEIEARATEGFQSKGTVATIPNLSMHRS